MRKFWSFITNGIYSVGCSGQTVWLYDSAGAELARFKDIGYGYDAAFSPVSNMFVVKSTGAYFAVYDADKRALLHKVRYSDVDGSQDDGFCFSPDGKYFINAERQRSSVNHAVSVYETEGFARVGTACGDDDTTEPCLVEFGEDGTLYVLGFLRGDNGVMRGAFVAKLGRNGLEEPRAVDGGDYEFYRNFKKLEARGFTEKAKEWSGFKYAGVDMTGMENEKHPLCGLWKNT